MHTVKLCSLEDDEVVFSYIEPHLIPYLKEVERFDELSAMGKIKVDYLHVVSCIQ